MSLAELPHRGVIAITGADRVGFLQGLVSNDVARAASGRAVWAALLTAQGRWLADFFVFAEAERLLLDCERAEIPTLLARLGRYRLRAAVALADVSADLSVYALWNGVPEQSAVLAAPDPRLAEAGFRLLSPAPLAVNAAFADWDRHRLSLGLPDGSRDLESGRTLLLEAGFGELDGVSWSKGCYLGQEVTARTRYRGLIKRRLVPVLIKGPPPAPGTAVSRNGEACGTMRSSAADRGLAALRLEALEGPLTSGEATLEVVLPAWLELTPAAAPAQ